MVSTSRPVTGADTATGLVPEPGEVAHGALDPYEVVVPYSNLQSLTSAPLGLTVAFSVAVAWLTGDAAPVTTVGAGPVVNTHAAPTLKLSPKPPANAVVPAEERATLWPNWPLPSSSLGTAWRASRSRAGTSRTWS